MKTLNIFLTGLLLMAGMMIACEEGIDPITQVDPGPDEADPTITIKSPTEGTTLKVLEEVTSIDIDFEVQDDIEIATVTVAVNGSEIAAINEFTDYRILKEQLTFDNVTNGQHTLTVTAADMEGKTSTQTVNFSKEPPYTPQYAGEFLYMPFENDYVDLVNIKRAEQVGSPGFTSTAYQGTSAYQGAADSYLELPFDGSIGTEFTMVFWYNVNASPERAGILVAGDDAEDRMQGFRLFREGSADEQRIKLNIGTGDAESWNDGGVINPASGDWVHVAVTVTNTESVIYLNGIAANTGTLASPIDWTGVQALTIGSGGETFSYWNHLHDASAIDELRFFNIPLPQSEIQELANFSGPSLHMPFDGEYVDAIANRAVTVVGTPGFAGEGKAGTDAYQGAADSYLTLPTAGLLGQELSGTFWYKVSATPDRAGILVIGPPDEENEGFPETQNKRTSGFRLFREGSAEEQRIKLNVGTGEGESWNDGGTIAPAAGDWVFVAFTISPTETAIYLNGELANTGTLAAPVDWTGTDLLSVMSGAPRFTGWGHLADASAMDELKLYTSVLTAEEIAAAMTE